MTADQRLAGTPGIGCAVILVDDPAAIAHTRADISPDTHSLAALSAAALCAAHELVRKRSPRGRRRLRVWEAIAVDSTAYWWTRDDLRQVEELLRVQRADAMTRFVDYARGADLGGDSPHSADAFLLLFVVTAAATAFGRRRSTPRDDDFWGELRSLPDSHHISSGLIEQVQRFSVDPKSLHREGGDLPGPPRDVADMYTMCVCCNLALDASVKRFFARSTWDRQFRTLAKSFRRKRLGVPADYRCR